ncbi:MAG TPA: cobalt-precorrin-5B (C(1))-methyltransferase [Methanosarcinaceae archaeon]|nr:cobalt-precorrin-5B (C(1))-methyltransferase [Methanosarcinaceae archaeon]
MIDPVDNFKIPDEWIARIKIPLDELENLVSRGLVVVLSNGSILKRGYTTGTTAAAAAKAAVLSFKENIDHVCVPTPVGLRACLGIKMQNGCAIATKTHSDHESDITRGLEFKACARLMKNTEKTASSARRITILASEGIGTVVRDGLEVKKGSPAINPVPMRQIHDAVIEALDEMGSEMGFEDVEVTLSVPKGAEIGKETLNSRIGVEGGISILGTTGFVEPWNDHLGETKEILTKEATKVVITTGRLGMRYSTMLFPDHTIVMFGSRISEGLKAASGNVEEIVVCGLPGLVLKWGNPDILKDSGFATVSDMVINDPGNERLTSAFEQTVKKANSARIVIIDRSGAVLMDSGVMS